MTYSIFDLGELASWERVKQGKIYPKGTLLIQISATNGQILLLDEPKEVDPKYAVITPNEKILAKYLYYVMNGSVDEYLHNYKTGLNIQIRDLKHFKIKVISLKRQKEFIAIMENFDKELKITKKELNAAKDIKRNMLDNMFPK